MSTDRKTLVESRGGPKRGLRRVVESLVEREVLWALKEFVEAWWDSYSEAAPAGRLNSKVRDKLRECFGPLGGKRFQTTIARRGRLLYFRRHFWLMREWDRLSLGAQEYWRQRGYFVGYKGELLRADAKKRRGD